MTDQTPAPEAMSDPLNPFPGNLRQHQVKPTEKDLEVTVTQRAKLEPSSRPDMLTDEVIEELAAMVYPFDIWLNKDQRGRSTIQFGLHRGFIQGLRYARYRFSAPPAIDVETNTSER